MAHGDEQLIVVLGDGNKLDEQIADAVADAVVDASDITFTPAGSIAATDLQAAIEELGSEDAATHIADATDAHDASAISVDSTNLVGVGTDVQTVLGELDDGIADHLADTSDAHDASAVSIVDAGGYYTGSHVEAALAEVGPAKAQLAATLTDEVVLIDITAGAEGDTFKLTYNGNEGTGPAVTIPAGGHANLTAADIRTHLITIADFSGATGDIAASGGPGEGTMTFSGALGGLDLGAITITSKTGAADGTVTEVTKGGQVKATALTVHTDDATDAHDASAISVDSTGLVGVGTDLQTVLGELDDGIADHLADTADAHDASAISVADTDNYFTGSDVETVLDQVGEELEKHETRLDNTLTNEVVFIDITAGAENDTFKLTYNGVEGTPEVVIPGGGHANVTAAQLKTNLITIPYFQAHAADITPSGGPGEGTLTFGGWFAGRNLTGITITSKTGAADGTVSVTTEGGKVADLVTHEADTADAHDASAVSVLDTAGYFAGTDVEAVLAEMYQWSSVRKAAITTIQSDDSLNNDPDLTFAVVANGVYEFEAFIIGETANAAANGIDLTFTCPAAGSGGWGDLAMGNAAWFEAEVAAGDYKAFGTEVAAAYDMSSGRWVFRAQGLLLNGANGGSVTFQWAQNTSHASDTSVLAGSYLRYRRLA